ncbi:uncharacterized protein LOC144442834 [Glandiceps talaboti]
MASTLNMWRCIVTTTLILLTCVCPLSGAICDPDQWYGTIAELLVCKSEQEKPNPEELIFPTNDCYYNSATIDDFSISSSAGDGDIDVVSVSLGEDVQFSCHVRKNGLESYIMFLWLCRRSSPQFYECLCPNKATRPNSKVPLKFSETYEQDLTLNYTLRDVDQSSSDDYYCLTQISGGSQIYGISTISIDVKKDRKPEIVKSPSNTTVYAGEEIIFSCEANGFPIPMYTWWKDEEVFDPENSTHIWISSSGSTLHINSTIPEDTGKYRCTAMNNLGTATSQLAMLAVIQETEPVDEIRQDEPNLIPIVIGIMVAVIVVIVVVVTSLIIYQRRVNRKREEQRQKEEEANRKKRAVVTIDRLEGNNVTLNIGGDRTEVNFGNVNIGGTDLLDLIEEPENLDNNFEEDIDDNLVDPNEELPNPDPMEYQYGDEDNDNQENDDDDDNEEVEMLNMLNV